LPFIEDDHQIRLTPRQAEFLPARLAGSLFLLLQTTARVRTRPPSMAEPTRLSRSIVPRGSCPAR